MERAKRRSSILKRPANNDCASPTQTFTKMQRRISFSGVKSVKEFIECDNQETIWCSSYEESADNQRMVVASTTQYSVLSAQYQTSTTRSQSQTQMAMSSIQQPTILSNDPMNLTARNCIDPSERENFVPVVGMCLRNGRMVPRYVQTWIAPNLESEKENVIYPDQLLSKTMDITMGNQRPSVIIQSPQKSNLSIQGQINTTKYVTDPCVDSTRFCDLITSIEFSNESIKSDKPELINQATITSNPDFDLSDNYPPPMSTQQRNISVSQIQTRSKMKGNLRQTIYEDDLGSIGNISEKSISVMVPNKIIADVEDREPTNLKEKTINIDRCLSRNKESDHINVSDMEVSDNQFIINSTKSGICEKSELVPNITLTQTAEPSIESRKPVLRDAIHRQLTNSEISFKIAEYEGRNESRISNTFYEQCKKYYVYKKDIDKKMIETGESHACFIEKDVEQETINFRNQEITEDVTRVTPSLNRTVRKSQFILDQENDVAYEKTMKIVEKPEHKTSAQSIEQSEKSFPNKRKTRQTIHFDGNDETLDVTAIKKSQLNDQIDIQKNEMYCHIDFQETMRQPLESAGLKNSHTTLSVKNTDAIVEETMKSEQNNVSRQNETINITRQRFRMGILGESKMDKSEIAKQDDLSIDQSVPILEKISEINLTGGQPKTYAGNMSIATKKRQTILFDRENGSILNYTMPITQTTEQHTPNIEKTEECSLNQRNIRRTIVLNRSEGNLDETCNQISQFYPPLLNRTINDQLINNSISVKPGKSQQTVESVETMNPLCNVNLSETMDMTITPSNSMHQSQDEKHETHGTIVSNRIDLVESIKQKLKIDGQDDLLLGQSADSHTIDQTVNTSIASKKNRAIGISSQYDVEFSEFNPKNMTSLRTDLDDTVAQREKLLAREMDNNLKEKNVSQLSGTICSDDVQNNESTVSKFLTNYKKDRKTILFNRSMSMDTDSIDQQLNSPGNRSSKREISAIPTPDLNIILQGKRNTGNFNGSTGNCDTTKVDQQSFMIKSNENTICIPKDGFPINCESTRLNIQSILSTRNADRTIINQSDNIPIDDQSDIGKFAKNCFMQSDQSHKMINQSSSLRLFRPDSTTPNNTEMLCHLDPEAINHSVDRRRQSNRKGSRNDDTAVNDLKFHKREFYDLVDDDEIESTHIDLVQSYSNSSSIRSVDTINNDKSKSTVTNSCCSNTCSSPSIINVHESQSILQGALDKSDVTEDDLECEQIHSDQSTYINKLPKSTKKPLDRQKVVCSNCNNTQSSNVSILKRNELNDTTVDDCVIRVDFSGYNRFTNIATSLDVLKAYKNREWKRLKSEMDRISQNVPAPDISFLLENIRLTEYVPSCLDDLSFKEDLTAIYPIIPKFEFLLKNRFEWNPNGWKYDDLLINEGIIKFENININSITFVFTYNVNTFVKYLEEHGKIKFDEVNYLEHERTYPDEHLRHNDFIRKFPAELTTWCPTSNHLISFLNEMFQIYRETFYKVKEIELIAIKKRAIIKHNERGLYLVKKIFNQEELSVQKIFIILQPINDIGPDNIFSKPLVKMKSHIHQIPKGVEFLRIFLENPLEYIVKID